jgi:hypothetical protein
MSAAKTGQVLTGDVIVEVDGIPTEGKSHDEVVQMLKGSSGEHVTLTLRRDNPAGAGGLIPGGPTDVTGTLYKVFLLLVFYSQRQNLSIHFCGLNKNGVFVLSFERFFQRIMLYNCLKLKNFLNLSKLF